MTSESDSGRTRGLVGLLLLLVVAAAYDQCLTSKLIYRDDYYLLWEWRQEPSRVLSIWNAAGRWANGLMFRLTWQGAEAPADLWKPRLVALGGIYALAIGCYVTARRLRYSWQLALGWSALSAVLPTFQVYAAWATCAHHVYAGLFALAAFWLAEFSARCSAWWRSIGGALCAGGLLFFGFSIYQPPAMLYVTFAALAWAAEDQLSRPLAWRRWLLHAAVLGLGLAAHIVVFKSMTGVAAGVNLAERAALSTDYGTKFARFMLQPVGQSCLPWGFANHWPKGLMACVVVLVLGILVPLGLWSRWQGTAREKTLRIVVLLALVPLSYLPNLLVASDFFPFRTRAAVSMLILLLLLLAAGGFLRHSIPAEQLRQRAATFALFASLVLAVLLARQHLQQDFYAPLEVEWRFMREAVTRAIEQGPTHPQQVVFIQPDSEQWIAPRFIYDEFGRSHATEPSLTRSLVGLALVEIAPELVADFEAAEFRNVETAAALPSLKTWIVRPKAD